MQNAGQYGQGAASAHPPSQFVPSEPSPNSGSTTSSLRQFRKKDADKNPVEQLPLKQMSESHVARVAPHNHYPPIGNDVYRYGAHQYPGYSSQVKYSDLAEPNQPNLISTSVIQKPKKDFMDICNPKKEYMEMYSVQQQHLNSHQQYSPDNGQYMHKDPAQGYQTEFKTESQFFVKDQHQYQQMPHHPASPKFNPMMNQSMRKYSPAPSDNPFLNKLSKLHPSIARSIMSDHHLQDTQPTYPPMDQRGMYGQQNHHYYSGAIHQPNPYSPNHNYSMNIPQPYTNYSPSSCSYPRSPQIQMGPVAPRYSHMERSMSPGRRGYPDNMHNMSPHMNYPNMHQKMAPGHNYPPQYRGAPEYAQHYQHRRTPQDCYPQLRPTQYMQNHHQIQGQDMQELPKGAVRFQNAKELIEQFMDDEPSAENNNMDANMNLRDKLRDDAPPGTVFMINANDVHYFENNGIPIVTSDNGSLKVTSENYQYLVKSGLVDNSGMVRIIEANKEISTDASGNQERVINLQIMETPAAKPDCMLANKPTRLPEANLPQASQIVQSKSEDESRRVVIHQNTILNPVATMDRRTTQQPAADPPQIPLHRSVVENQSITKELVDKNCSPINLDHLEHNLGFSEPEPPETETDNAETISKTVSSPKHSSFSEGQVMIFSEDLSQNSDDRELESPGSKSMPIIDFFAEAAALANDSESDDMEHMEDADLKDNVLEQIHAKCDSSSGEIMPIKGSEETPETPEDAPTAKNSEELKKKEPKDSIKSSESLKSDPEIFETIETSPSPQKDELATFEASSVIVTPDITETQSLSNKNVEISETNTENVSEEVEAGSHVKNADNIDANGRNNIETEAKLSSPLAVNSEATKPAPPIERRKRFFSVDDIIHNIGNNMRRGSRGCEPHIICDFIEKETEFSSLEQMEVRLPSMAKEEHSDAIGHQNTTDMTVEETDETFKHPTNQGSPVVEEASKMEVEKESAPLINEESQESLDAEAPSNMSTQELIETSLSSPTSTSILVKSEDQLNSKENNPSRSPLRIEGTTVLLQVAGELMEISVNVVNGKKVINVTPLSDSTTVVDYNDNYEVPSKVPASCTKNDSSRKDTDNTDNNSVGDGNEGVQMDADCGENVGHFTSEQQSSNEEISCEIAENIDPEFFLRESVSEVSHEQMPELQNAVSLAHLEQSPKNSDSPNTFEILEDAISNISENQESDVPLCKSNVADDCSAVELVPEEESNVNEVDTKILEADENIDKPTNNICETSIEFESVQEREDYDCSAMKLVPEQESNVNEVDTKILEADENIDKPTNKMCVTSIEFESVQEREATEQSVASENNETFAPEGLTEKTEKVDSALELYDDPVADDPDCDHDSSTCQNEVYEIIPHEYEDNKNVLPLDMSSTPNDSNLDPDNSKGSEGDVQEDIQELKNRTEDSNSTDILEIRDHAVNTDSQNCKGDVEALSDPPNIDDKMEANLEDRFHIETKLEDVKEEQECKGQHGTPEEGCNDSIAQIIKHVEPICDKYHVDSMEISSEELVNETSIDECQLQPTEKDLNQVIEENVVNSVEMNEDLTVNPVEIQLNEEPTPFLNLENVEINSNNLELVGETTPEQIDGRLIREPENNKDEVDQTLEINLTEPPEPIPEISEVALSEETFENVIKPDQNLLDIIPIKPDQNMLDNISNLDTEIMDEKVGEKIHSLEETESQPTSCQEEIPHPDHFEEAQLLEVIQISSVLEEDNQTLGTLESNIILKNHVLELLTESEPIVVNQPKEAQLLEDIQSSELEEDNHILGTLETNNIILENHVVESITESVPVVVDEETDHEYFVAGMLDFPLEDEVFIADPPAHEEIVTDPLEGVGVIAERSMLTDSPEIPLEVVTTTEEIIEKVDLIIPELRLEDTSVNSELLVQETTVILEDISTADTLDRNNIKEQLTHIIKECTTLDKEGCSKKIKVVKPEVQILSPTSTNIEDHITISKSNVYLEPRRKYSADNDVSEYTITPTVTTKAAKKLYESDLRVQHDIVSSSKKEDAPKQVTKSRKRSKRLNEKVQGKNEQKELLRILAEKRKRRRQKESLKLENTSTLKIKESGTKIYAQTEKGQSKNISSEHDDEYVDFKELLRARKLKKLKKLQESKARETKESESLKVKHSKTDLKDMIKGKHKTSSHHVRDQRLDRQSDCCIGCNSNSVKKSVKEEKPKTKNIKKLSLVAEDIKLLNVPKSSAVNPEKIQAENVQSERNPSPIKKAEVLKIPQNIPIDTKNVTPLAERVRQRKRISSNDDFPSSTSNVSLTSITAPKSRGLHPKDPRRNKPKSLADHVMVPSVSELIEENSGGGSKKKISLADYVSRKRKSTTCTENTKVDAKEKRHKLNSVGYERTSSTECSSVKSDESTNNNNVTIKPPKTLSDLKTSFVIHSSDWEDSNSPAPTPTRSNEECLFEDFSGLIKHNNSKKPVIDVNELTPLENPKDRKLQEYKDKVDSQLSSLLHIQIPKSKSQYSPSKVNLDPCGSSGSLVTRFLKNEKLSQSEMEKIKKIVSYKRSIHQKNAKSPSKSPASSSLGCEFGAVKSPVYTDSSPDPTYEVRNNSRLEADPKEVRLHLKKVNAKRKLHLISDEDSSSVIATNQSENSPVKKNVNYSVFSRLGEDGLPKIIFKRNKWCNLDKQPVVELVKLDLNNLEKVKAKYNVTVRQMM